MELNFEFVSLFFIIIIFLIVISYIYFNLSKIKISLFLILFIIPVASFSLYLSLPNFMCVREIAKMASVKANMHTFQTILETYSVDANGLYPKNVEELKKFATTGDNQYWKDFKNPFTAETGKGNSYDDFDKNLREKKTIGWFFKEEIKCVACVYYSFSMNKKGQINGYFIYGSDKKGEIITDLQSGLPFTLSNN